MFSLTVCLNEHKILKTFSLSSNKLIIDSIESNSIKPIQYILLSAVMRTTTLQTVIIWITIKLIFHFFIQISSSKTIFYSFFMNYQWIQLQEVESLKIEKIKDKIKNTKCRSKVKEKRKSNKKLLTIKLLKLLNVSFFSAKS